MDLSFIVLIVVLLITGVVVDVTIFRVRRNLYARNSSVIDELSSRTRRLLPTKRIRHDAPSTPVAPVSARMKDNAEVRSMPKIPAEPPIVFNEISPPGEAENTNIATVQIIATVPVGTSLNISVSAVRGAKDIVVRQEYKRSVHASTPATSLIRSIPRRIFDAVRDASAGATTKSRVLFGAALTLYSCCVLIGVEQYPIFFFTDEAVHSNFAASLWQNGLRGPKGDLLPTYFQIDPSFGLNGTSVYIHLLPTGVFGQSVLVTRSTAALITLLAAVCVSLHLRDGLRVKNWWLGALVLCASPAWFLHARTAFEYMLVATFFAATLYLYQRYRDGADRYLFACLASAALTFYSHGLGQVLIAVAALVLGIADLRHHADPRRRRTLLLAFIFALVLSLPWVRFQLSYDDVVMAQIRQRSSYWTNDSLSLFQKFQQWASEYLYGIDPRFWFLPNDRDLARHTIPGTGGLLLASAPFALLGIATCIQRIRDAAHRNVLAALLIAPLPATIVTIGTPRLLWMIVPWTILIVIGIERTIELAKRRSLRIAPILPVAAYVGLAASATILLTRANTVGRTWHSNYSLYGQQFGARQVFGDVVAPMLNEDADARLVVSPSWANGTDQFVTFFVPKENRGRVSMGQPIDWIYRRDEVTPKMYFVATRDEFTKLSENPMFTDLAVRRVVSYPDDTPGFYVLNLNFSLDADQMIAAERAERRTPITSTFAYLGKSAIAVHSPFGEGDMNRLFDGNAESLVRGLEANPLLIDFSLPEPVKTGAIAIHTGSMQSFTITARCHHDGSAEPAAVSRRFDGLGPDPLVTLDLPSTLECTRIGIEVRDETAQDAAQIHVREITLR